MEDESTIQEDPQSISSGDSVLGERPNQDQSDLQASKYNLSITKVVAWTVLVLQFVFAIVLCLMIVYSLRVATSTNASLFIGFIFVQIFLLSVAITLAPASLITRVFVCTLAVAFFCSCMYRCALRDGGGHGIAMAIVGAMLAQWALFQIPLWFVRGKGWKLALSGTTSEGNRKKEVQFGIKHLLIWTTIVAVFMGMIQAAMSGIAVEGIGARSRDLVLGIVLTLGNSIIAIQIVWGCLSRSYFWFWLLVTVLVCLGVCAVEYFMGFGQTEFLILINLTQTILATILMLALRATGFRLRNTYVEASLL